MPRSMTSNPCTPKSSHDVLADIVVVALDSGDYRFRLRLRLAAPPAVRYGSMTFMPSFITSPATTSSDRKYSPSSNFRPTSTIPGTIPSVMAYRGSTPASIADWATV